MPIVLKRNVWIPDLLDQKQWTALLKIKPSFNNYTTDDWWKHFVQLIVKESKKVITEMWPQKNEQS